MRGHNIENRTLSLFTIFIFLPIMKIHKSGNFMFYGEKFTYPFSVESVGALSPSDAENVGPGQTEAVQRRLLRQLLHWLHPEQEQATSNSWSEMQTLYPAPGFCSFYESVFALIDVDEYVRQVKLFLFNYYIVLVGWTCPELHRNYSYSGIA